MQGVLNKRARVRAEPLRVMFARMRANFRNINQHKKAKIACVKETARGPKNYLDISGGLSLLRAAN